MKAAWRTEPFLPGISLIRPSSRNQVPFEEVSARLGVQFEHHNCPTSNKYLVETMGGGVALLDYDNDGRLDIFFTNGARLADPMPHGALPDKTDPRYWNRLFHQNADGTSQTLQKKQASREIRRLVTVWELLSAIMTMTALRTSW